jgi:phage/plasmid-associated DNA primase
VFFGNIHHDFSEFDDEEMQYMDDLEQRLFFNVLGEEVGTYFMVMLVRGDMRMKNIMFCLGDTDCGKSTLTTAITLSCGDYVGSFNAENLAYRNTSNDEAQIMRWAMLLRYKRFIFSNEMKSTSELNGNIIKKI